MWQVFFFLLSSCLLFLNRCPTTKKRDRYFIPMKESHLYTTGPAGINLPLPILPPHHQSSAFLAPPVWWMVILRNLPGGLIEMHFKMALWALSPACMRRGVYRKALLDTDGDKDVSANEPLLCEGGVTPLQSWWDTVYQMKKKKKKKSNVYPKLQLSFLFKLCNKKNL